METIGNLDHMTGGMLYWSITHLQREDTLQVSDVSDTLGQPYGLEAVTASTKGRKRAHAMPNVPASCVSVSLFSFRYFHAIHQPAT